MDDHVLIGARVNLENDAKFESRNRLLTEDRGGVGVIDPFVISVSNDDVMLTRNDIFDPNQPNARVIDLTDQQLQRRGPIDLEGMTIDQDTIAAATGILDAVQYRANRRKLLEVDVVESVDAVERAALHKRIDELRRAGARDLRIVMMTVLQRRRFALNGRAVVDDRSSLLGCTPDLTAKWPIEFWMGAWDSDALSGYIKGVLGLPCEKAGS